MLVHTPLHLSCAQVAQASVSRALSLSLGQLGATPEPTGTYRIARLAKADLCETLLCRAATDLENALEGSGSPPEAVRCFVIAHLQDALLHWLSQAHCSSSELEAVAQCLAQNVSSVSAT